MDIEEIEEKIKNIVIHYFEFEFTDEYGYVTEKRDKIRSLSKGQGWVAFQMLHPTVRRVLFNKLNDKQKAYLITNDIIL